MNSGSSDVAEEKKPKLSRRVRDAVACWYVLLLDKLFRHGRRGPQATNCLQLKKGTRFRLSGGEVQLLEDELGSHVAEPAFVESTARSRRSIRANE